MLLINVTDYISDVMIVIIRHNATEYFQSAIFGGLAMYIIVTIYQSQYYHNTLHPLHPLPPPYNFHQLNSDTELQELCSFGCNFNR